MADSLKNGAENLLSAIKRDDPNAFSECFKAVGAVCFGRFPLLSVLYLYNSKKILAECEEELLSLESGELTYEPASVYLAFAKRAGKCLRLYIANYDSSQDSVSKKGKVKGKIDSVYDSQSTIVTPAEMLLILDENAKLKRLYPKMNVSLSARQRMKAIYKIKYALKVDFKDNEIVMERRPLTRREKKKIIISVISAVLCLAILISTPFIVNVFKPFIGVKEQTSFAVTSASQINFESTHEYTLEKDIAIESGKVDKINCNIIGNGKTIKVESGATLGDLSGTISNVTFETKGTIFNTVNEGAKIENCTVNCTLNNVHSEDFAVLALTNFGMIDGVNVNVNGRLTARTPAGVESDENFEGLNFSGLVGKNRQKSSQAYGVVQNCSVNFDNLTLSGEVSANATFAGVASTNTSYIMNCEVSGAISASVFDLVGVCAINDYLLKDCVNTATLSQSTDSLEWNPLVAGIVMTNRYAVENCVNSGNITSISTSGTQEDAKLTSAVAVGVAYMSYKQTSNIDAYLLNCKNTADISASANFRSVYAFGICYENAGAIQGGVNEGNVSATCASDCDAYASGIAGYNGVAFVRQTILSNRGISKSKNSGNVTASTLGTAYAGGIAALSVSYVQESLSQGGISAEGKECYAGGVFAYSDIASDLFYIYVGNTASVISDCTVSVKQTGEGGKGFAGGIAGYIAEKPINFIGEPAPIPFGGGVQTSYFTGVVQGEGDTLLGGVVGCVGKYIHDTNLYFSGGREYHNFESNFFVPNGKTAIGGTVETVTTGVEYGVGGNVGSSPYSKENIVQSTDYLKILSILAESEE